MNGRLTHFELGAPDMERARAFFGQLLGWRFSPYGEGSAIDAAGQRGGLHQERPGGFTPFFAVDDLEAAILRVRSLGGEASEPTPVEPGFGRFSMCRDDQGVPFGLQQLEG